MTAQTEYELDEMEKAPGIPRHSGVREPYRLANGVFSPPECQFPCTDKQSAESVILRHNPIRQSGLIPAFVQVNPLFGKDERGNNICQDMRESVRDRNGNACVVAIDGSAWREEHCLRPTSSLKHRVVRISIDWYAHALFGDVKRQMRCRVQVRNGKELMAEPRGATATDVVQVVIEASGLERRSRIEACDCVLHTTAEQNAEPEVPGAGA